VQKRDEVNEMPILSMMVCEQLKCCPKEKYQSWYRRIPTSGLSLRFRLLARKKQNQNLDHPLVTQP
jgi:hypothetical protein